MLQMDIFQTLNFRRKVRIRYPNHIIIAGNVATSEMTEALCLEGGGYCEM